MSSRNQSHTQNTQTLESVAVKRGKDKPIKHNHPWLFSNSILNESAKLRSGDIVRVNDEFGGFLAYGVYNADSKIVLRFVEWDENVAVDDHWWRKKIRESIGRRLNDLKNEPTSGIRLVAAENDFLPGLLVDYFNGYLVVQFLTSAIERYKDLVVEELNNTLKPMGIVERSENVLRRLEGLEPNIEHLSGDNPGETLVFTEGEVKLQMRPYDSGQVQFYIDQKRCRLASAKYFKNKRVLDCFCHSGEFSLHALKNEALEVVSVDIDEDALAHYKANLALNGFDVPEENIKQEDVFKSIRHFNDMERHFDVIIMNPPKFAPTRAYAEKAQKAYKDLHLNAMKNLRPGGILIALSCSGGINSEQLKQVLSWAALDANRHIQIVEQIYQGNEVPVRLSFPESEYLKGFVCEVI